MASSSSDFRQTLAVSLPAGGLSLVSGYVALSLAGAIAGSVAAVLLVPLVHPGRGSLLPLAAFAAVIALFALLRWQTSRLGARLTSRFAMNLRRRVHERLIEAPLAALADRTSAEIANVLTYNVELITQGFSALLQLLVAGATAVVGLGFACWISPPLVFVAPVLLGVALLVPKAHAREQSRVSLEYLAELTRLFWLSEDFPRRLRHVRSFGRVDAEKSSCEAITARLGRAYQRQQELSAASRLMIELLAAAAIAAVFLLAQRLRGIDTASLITVCLLLGRLLPYLAASRQSLQMMRAAAPAFGLWRRYLALDAATVAQTTAPSSPGIRPLHIEKIRLTVPRGLEIGALTLSPGTLTVICGDSGIGKSSLMDVLAGLAQPESFIARRGNRPMSFDEYRELIGRGAFVSQNVRPWQEGVRDCLLWAAPEAGDELLRSALADVGFDASLDSSAGRLSGGELQRLMLAQVLLRQPTLAVLDEATNALDAGAENRVLEMLKRRLPDTILIVVSHRIGVLAVADQSLTLGADRPDAVRNVAATAANS